MRVLFVDDTTYNMKYFVQALREAGITVELRSDVDKAFECFESHQDWSGAIIDVTFDTPTPPERYSNMDPAGQKVGLLLARDLRKIAPTLKIIALTNLAGSAAAADLGRLTDVHVVSKLKTDPISFRNEVLEFFKAD
jgi:CheY-like chemotaxis protein